MKHLTENNTTGKAETAATKNLFKKKIKVQIKEVQKDQKKNPKYQKILNPQKSFSLKEMMNYKKNFIWIINIVLEKPPFIKEIIIFIQMQSSLKGIYQAPRKDKIVSPSVKGVMEKDLNNNKASKPVLRKSIYKVSVKLP